MADPSGNGSLPRHCHLCQVNLALESSPPNRGFCVDCAPLRGGADRRPPPHPRGIILLAQALYGVRDPERE